MATLFSFFFFFSSSVRNDHYLSNFPLTLIKKKKEKQTKILNKFYILIFFFFKKYLRKKKNSSNFPNFSSLQIFLTFLLSSPFLNTPLSRFIPYYLLKHFSLQYFHHSFCKYKVTKWYDKRFIFKTSLNIPIKLSHFDVKSIIHSFQIFLFRFSFFFFL